MIINLFVLLQKVSFLFITTLFDEVLKGKIEPIFLFGNFVFTLLFTFLITNQVNLSQLLHFFFLNTDSGCNLAESVSSTYEFLRYC